MDEVWKDRPALEINPVNVHALKFAGRSVEEKLKDLRHKLVQEKARGIIFTALDEVSFFLLLIVDDRLHFRTEYIDLSFN